MKHLAGLLLLCLLICVASTLAQTTGFTFQGRLNDGGTPANGLYDFQFWLFDSLADGSGTQLGTQNVPGVQVTNGVFSVTLDFGSTAFSGPDRFIQVVVRPSVNDPTVIPTILSPRQRLTSTPYAVRSLTAANAEQLAGVNADQYVITGDFRLSDARTPTPGSPDYIQNSTATQPTSNFSISGTGKADTFDAATQFNIAGVRVLGNAGPTNFIAGQGAGQSISTGDSNAFFGLAAGQNTADGRQNSFFGRNAGKLNTSGSFNAFFGSGSGFSNIDGNNNAFFGYTSGQSNSSGFNNSFFGNAAGLKTTLGGNNTFTGFFAGSNTTTGQQNTFFGASTGATNTTGGYNTLLGYGSDVGSAALSNATAIGAQAAVSQSNSLVLGSINGVNNATADTNVGIGTTAPNTRLHVVGDGLFSGNLTVGGTINGTFNGTIQTANNALNLGGIAANQFVQTTDPRLSDARTPTAGSANYIQNTTSQQASTNFNIGGNGTVSGILSGNVVNAVSQYNINGNRVINAPGSNIFIGLGNTGATNTTGNSNSFFGFGSGQINTTGSANSFFGGNAGTSNNGGDNSFFGASAGFNNTTGSTNSFFGYDTGGQNTTGSGNTFVGAFSATSTSNLVNATAIGYASVVEASNSVILGGIAGVGGCLPVNNCADTNVGIGTTTPTARLHVVGDGLFTGNLTVSGSLNANISLSTVNATQYNLGGAQIIGGNGDQFVGNFFAGFRSGQSLTNGTYNSFFGIEAGKMNDSGGRNSFFGYQAGLQNTAGHDNSYFGYNAGLRCGGSGNSFFGQGTGLGSGSPPPNDCTGSNNSFFGQNAGTSLTNGQNNAAVGQGAGSGLASGSFNSFLGAGAGAGTIEGNNNTFIGQSTGGFNRFGTGNTAVGSNAWIGSSPAFNNLSNATAIGANSCVTASDSLVLGGITNCGNPNGRDTNVGIGTSAPTARLHVVGDGLFTGNLTVNGTISGNISSGNFIQNTTAQQASSNFNISGTGIIAGTAIVGVNNVQPLSQARLQIFDNNGSIHLGGTCNSGANAVGFASTFTCANYSVQGNGSDTMVNRAAGGNLFFREANTNEMTIIPGGNVGIGTTSPTAKLHVVGDGLFTGNLNVSGALNGSTQFNIGGNRVLSVSGSQNTNTFVGVQAGNANPTGGFNSFFGSGAGMSATVGVNNSFFGSGSGNHVTDAGDNSFFGSNAGFANIAIENSFFGSYAGTANFDGRSNSFFGYRAGASNIGVDPGPFGTGQGGVNAFFGAYAGENNTYGDNNAFFGYGSGRNNTTGGFNTFIGVDAGVSNSNGNVNTFLGIGAGGNMSSGGGNTIVGGRAGGNFTSGEYNSFFGADIFMLSTSIVGNNVTLLGGRTRLGATASNATAVGAFATVTQDNSLVLGAINGVNGCSAGNHCDDTNVGIGTTTPQDRLHVNGNIRVTNGGIYVANPNTLIITSPNGLCWGITVNNSGQLSAFSTPCPP